MKQTEKEKRQQQYEDYVKKKTPVHNVYLNMAKAFLTGGIICVIGQGIYNYCEMIGLSKDHCSNWTSLSLILLSIILTGVGLYPKIAKWGGAGALVPITGFANSVAAPAIEYKKEGQVFGIGCKIFTISGPVILYGICTSSLLGLFVLDLDAVLKEEVRLLIRNLTSPFIPRFVSASDGSPVLILLHIILFAALHEASFFLIVFQ